MRSVLFGFLLVSSIFALAQSQVIVTVTFYEKETAVVEPPKPDIKHVTVTEVVKAAVTVTETANVNAVNSNNNEQKVEELRLW